MTPKVRRGLKGKSKSPPSEETDEDTDEDTGEKTDERGFWLLFEILGLFEILVLLEEVPFEEVPFEEVPFDVLLFKESLFLEIEFDVSVWAKYLLSSVWAKYLRSSTVAVISVAPYKPTPAASGAKFG